MEHSPQFEHLKERWDNKRISESLLRKNVRVGNITPEEFTEITGIPY